MISTPKGWIHGDDLRHPVPGRDDEPGLIEGCVSYLQHHASTQRPGTVGRSQRTRSTLLSARIAKAATGARHSDLDLREEVSRQRQAIDRLLALVQPRGAPVSEERLTAIAGDLARRAVELFPGATIVPVVANESDPDAFAAYRITLRISAAPTDPADAASRMAEIHGYLADVAADSEFESIRLVIDLV